MKTLFSILFTLFSYLLSAQVVINIDTTNKKQRITGMGTCSGSKDSDINDHLYDLRSSLIRLSLSLSNEKTLEELENDNNDPFTLDLSKFTWPSSQINIAKQSHQSGAKILMGVFSPPAWMKSNGSVNNGGTLIDSLYEEFGEWALGCAQSFRQQAGFDIYSFGTQNEPQFVEPYASCVYNEEQLMRASKVIGKRFEENNIPTKIFHGSILFTQGKVVNFFQAANNDDSCKNYIDAFSIHIGSGNAINYQNAYNECQRVDPKKEFWLSENSYIPDETGKRTFLEDGISEACQLYDGLKYGNLSAWLFCGANSKDVLHPYYVHKQFIRYIRPGSVRHESVSSDADVLPLAFKQDSLNNYIITLINRSTSEKKCSINLPGYNSNFEIFRTSANEFCEYAGNTALTEITLPSLSVSTLIYASDNKLPTIDRIDTIIAIRNTSGNIALSGISDGDDGTQEISISAYSTFPIFNSLSVDYLSPNSSGVIHYALKNNTGTSKLVLSISDQSSSMDSAFNQKQMFIDFIVIPFINLAPSFDALSNISYPETLFNKSQMISLSNLNDGNGGVQKLSVTAISSDPSVLQVSTQGAAIINLTPIKNGTITLTVQLKDDGDTYLGGINSVSQTITIVCGTGINELNNANLNYSVYPNPTEDIVCIKNITQNTKYILFNSQGSIIRRGYLNAEENSLSLKELNSGIYFIRTEDAINCEVLQIIKQ